MKSLHRLVASTAIAVGVSLGAGMAIGQQKQPENKVLAIVNGHKITTKEVKLATDDILPHLTSVPPKSRFAFVVEYLIERRLLAQQAIREGLGNSNEYKTRLVFYQAKALRDAYFVEKLKAKITDEVVRATYDKEAANIAPTERFRARHILVATEKEANDILARLKKGEDFAKLAKEKSLDGSKDFGGDLGYFTASEMVKEFADTVKKLKKGDISKPVKTEFGWHVIRLEDKKVGGPRPYEEVKNGIKLVLLRKAVQDKIQELRKSAKIEMVDETLKKMLAAQKQALEKAKAAKKSGKSNKASN